MYILKVLKELKKGCWYQVPVDFYGHATTYMPYSEAGKALTTLANHWSKQSVVTNFTMDKETKEMPVWCSMERKMIIREVIEIKMTNERIKKFNPN